MEDAWPWPDVSVNADDENDFLKTNAIPKMSRHRPQKKTNNKAAEFPEDPVKENLRRIFAGVSIYFNYTGEAKCLQMADPDQIGSSMWDYQVSKQ